LAVIAVIGGGYVGLVTAAGLASLGHVVRVGERDAERVGALREGRIPIFEPGLGRLVTKGVEAELLSFTENNVEAVTGAGFVFLTLPTPSLPDGSADTSFVESVIGQLSGRLDVGAIMVLKSTVPVGSTRRFQAMLAQGQPEIPVVSNPEFLREGNAVDDFLQPDRVVVGADDADAARAVAGLYQPLGAPVMVMDPVSAEMVKYGSNAYLAARITFANTLANVCEAVDADVTAVLGAVGMDKRIGPHFLRPGPGFGGSCFPKDTQALLALSGEAGYEFRLLEAVIAADLEQRTRIVDKVRRAVGGELAGRTIGLWGLAFKAGTDDVRASPAVDIADGLLAQGARVKAHDPEGRLEREGLVQVDSPIEAALGADAVVVATEWPEFAAVAIDQVAAAMRGNVIVDARNLLDPERVVAAGLRYEGVGRRLEAADRNERSR
jgi:UDPglucose 6-dehydrogenase